MCLKSPEFCKNDMRVFTDDVNSMVIPPVKCTECITGYRPTDDQLKCVAIVACQYSFAKGYDLHNINQVAGTTAQKCMKCSEQIDFAETCLFDSTQWRWIALTCKDGSREEDGRCEINIDQDGNISAADMEKLARLCKSAKSPHTFAAYENCDGGKSAKCVRCPAGCLKCSFDETLV
jgi:hypothetical protein